MENEIIPCGKRVLLRKAEPETEKNGLIIPKSSKERYSVGIIVALNEDEEHEQLEIGYKIMYNYLLGVEVSYDGKDYVLLDEDDVLCILPS